MKMQLSSSINEYLNKEEYLIKTLAQIRRDFEMSGSTFEGEFNEMINYQALLNLVYENIYSFFQGNSSLLKNLLYRIDISQKAIQQRMFDRSDDQIEEVICQLIIERCILKVLTKEKFSKS